MSPELLNPIEQCYREQIAQGRAVLRLHSGNPGDYGIHFPTDVLADCYAPWLRTLTYQPDPQGLPSAREAIAGYYATHGNTIHPAHLVCTSGTSESFRYLCDLLAAPGDNMLFPVPGYPLFTHIAELNHVAARHYQLDESLAWRINLDSLERAIDARTRAIVVISPHNPTGMVASADEWRALAALAARHNLALIADEVFREFWFGDGAYPDAFQAATAGAPRVFVMNGISKMFALPALKLGWIVAAGADTQLPALVDRLALIADTFLSCHAPIQQALPALFREGADFVQQYRALVAERRNAALAVCAAAPHLHCTPPAGGFYCTVRVQSDRWHDEEALVCTLLRAHGLFVHPGYFYDCADGPHLVMAYLAETAVLQQALHRMVQTTRHG